MNQPAMLIDRIISGDPAAEKQLIETYYQGLLFILFRQTGQMALAEDLTQDSFLIILRKLRNGDLRNKEALAAFIRQTGINTLIAYRRQQARRQTESSDNIDVFESSQPTLLQQLHTADARKVVSRVLAELSTPRDRDILESFYLHDKDKAEICEHFDLTPAHFDRVLFRARQRLKQLIQQNEETSVSVSQVIESLMIIGLLVPLTSTHTSVHHSSLLYKEVRESYFSYHLKDQNGANLELLPEITDGNYA